MEARGAALPSLVEFALSAMSVLYGGLLGVFAAGFAREPREGENRDRRGQLGLAVGSILGLAFFLQPLLGGDAWFAWGYRIPIAAALAFALSLFGVSRSPVAGLLQK
jgi:hypothetical protein